MPKKPDVTAPSTRSGFVRVRGARVLNLKNIDVDIPRDALVVFTGISGARADPIRHLRPIEIAT